MPAPLASTEFMVAYAYDQVSRVSPLAFFGMVHALEGTSTRIATQAADSLSQSLQLKPDCFSYLYSHGSLDQDHVEFFTGLMNRIQDPQDQRTIRHASLRFHQLSGAIFHELQPRHGLLRQQEVGHATGG